MTKEELDQKIVAYMRGRKSAPTSRTPLDTAIQAFYRQHPESRAAVDAVRNHPGGSAAYIADFLARRDNKPIQREHFTGGQILDVR